MTDKEEPAVNLMSASAFNLPYSLWKTPVFIYEQMKVKKLNIPSLLYENSFDLEDPLERFWEPSYFF